MGASNSQSSSDLQADSDPRSTSPEHRTEQDGDRKGPIRVIFARTTGLFADGLTTMLRIDPRIELLDEITEDEIPTGLHSNEPIVVLIECLLSAEACPAMLTRVSDALPSARALVVTRTVEDEELTAIIMAGAFGCLTTECRWEELIQAIERVSQGEVLFPPELLMRLLTQRPRRGRPGDADGPGEDEAEGPSTVATTPGARATSNLAPRERQVLETMALGLSTDEVAERLGITVHTVRTHLKNVLVKLNAHSKLEAVVIALREGLIELPR